MSGLLGVLLLAIVQLIGLVLIPFGLPGIWLMVAGIAVYAVVGGFQVIGGYTVAFVIGLAALAEVAEAWLGFRLARRYGGSKAAGWGAIIGGLIGAVLGTPVPVIGNVIGAFLGAFVGAVVIEFATGRKLGDTLGVGWGAVVGRAVGAAVKVMVGLVIAIVGIAAALA